MGDNTYIAKCHENSPMRPASSSPQWLCGDIYIYIYITCFLWIQYSLKISLHLQIWLTWQSLVSILSVIHMRKNKYLALQWKPNLHLHIHFLMEEVENNFLEALNFEIFDLVEIYRRYFFIWNGSEEYLEAFLKNSNGFDLNLKFIKSEKVKAYCLMS